MSAEKIKFQFSFFTSAILVLFFIIIQPPLLNAQSGFNCGDTIHYAGMVYNSVQIVDQCWMKENLNIGTMIPGDSNMTDNDTIEKYCYDNLVANCDEYGGLYQWHEMMKYGSNNCLQGICPDGWHVPTDADWKLLEGCIDSLYRVYDPEWEWQRYRGYNAGKHLKSTSGWWPYYSNCEGTDTYGFTAKPGGQRNYVAGEFEYIQMYSYFWTSTNLWYAPASSISRYMSCGGYGSKINRVGTYTTGGYSVRCIKTDFSLPAHVTVQDTTISHMEKACAGATDSITIAGNGTYFTVDSTAYVKIYAGNKIKFLPGTSINPIHNGRLNTFFQDSCTYCLLDNLIPLGYQPQSTPSSGYQYSDIPEDETETTSCIVFPNPTTGNFNVELAYINKDQRSIIEVYNMQGELVFRQKLNGKLQYEFSLMQQARGIYFIRIINGNETETFKLIRQ